VTAWKGKDERAKSERETERETIPVPGGPTEEMRRFPLVRLADARQSAVHSVSEVFLLIDCEFFFFF
jgi:hypothetical protein